MKTEEWKKRLLNGCRSVMDVEEVLTEIDSKFGDADHGLTMRKICEAIEESVKETAGGIKEVMEAAAAKVGLLNGGSAVPLWNSWLQGMADVAEDEMDLTAIKKMFSNGLEEFSFMSGAEVGDKTIMDALAPATAAIMKAEKEEDVFREAAKAANAGAEATKNCTARYGRAKSYGEKTLGTPDAGALSMAYFFRGLAEE